MWEGVGDRTELQYIDPNSYGHQHCVFHVLLMLNRRPGGSAFWWVLAFSTTTCHQRIWPPNSIEGPAGTFCWVVAFPTTSCLQLVWTRTDWLPASIELSNSSIAHSVSILIDSQAGICHFRRLWTGIFDHHQAEITVSSEVTLPVHQSMSVPWDFYLVPYRQPSPPTGFFLITAIGMCYFLPVHHLGIACLARSKVNIQQANVSIISGKT